MKVQENPSNGQKFVNLPKEICKAFDIRQGTDIEFSVVDKEKIMMSISQGGVG